MAVTLGERRRSAEVYLSINVFIMKRYSDKQMKTSKLTRTKSREVTFRRRRASSAGIAPVS